MTRLLSAALFLFALALQVLASPSSSPVVAELPPLSAESLEIVKRMPAADVQVGHNSLAQIKRAQQILQRRDAAIPGLVDTPNCANCFALTFDDGPYKYTLEIAKKVSAQGWKATWFVNGYNYDCIYDSPISDYIRGATVDYHMEVASHSWSHPNMSTLSYHDVDTQIELMEDALLKITGRVPALFRLPYGEGNSTLIDYINRRHGLTVIGWGADAGDSTGSSVAEQLDVIRSIKPGNPTILLQHDADDSTGENFDKEIEIIKKNGWQPESMVTVAHSLGIHAYKIRTSPQQRDSTWTCEGKPVPGQD